MIEITPDASLALKGISPTLVVSVAGLVAMMLCLVFRKAALAAAAIVSLVGVFVAMGVNQYLEAPTLGGLADQDVKSMEMILRMIRLDQFSWFCNLLILIAAGLTVLTSVKYMSDEGPDLYEYFVLLLFAAAGMMFMVSANHLLVVFVGLETLSISIYVLCGILPGNAKAKEAALKYLILGGFSSAVFLYGAALLYGATGSLGLASMKQWFAASEKTTLSMVGMGLVLVGFSFKVAAVPFHMWTPDVYEGAPTPMTGFMSVGVKAAAFAAFARVFFEGLQATQVNWAQILWVLSVLTMILGNLAALVQENIKRMLAYSSIAHAGYILMGMIAGTQAGVSGMLYYLLAYTFTNIGAFGVVALVGQKGEANLQVDDYRGLANTHPVLALLMSIFLFSLAGIPPTGGFVGKLTIFTAAISAGYIWLVIIGVLTSAASVYYYFRVVMKMYMEQREPAPITVSFTPAMALALGIAAIGVLYLGIFPTTWLDVAAASVKPLF